MKNINAMRGFSILEALVAFLVVGLGSITLTGFLSGSLEMNSDGKSRTQAMHMAKDVIEEFRGFSSVSEVTALTSDATGDSISDDFTTYSRTWTVTDVSGNNNAILVTVNVAWTGINGAQSLTLTSKIAKLKPESVGQYLL